MTRAKVFQLGFVVLALGAVGYGIFRFSGMDGASSGIAAEALLMVIVFGWIGSYLLRVVGGKMTFNEQRKRYREAYEQLTSSELKNKFDSMSEEEQIRLIQELNAEKNVPNAPSDS